MQPSMHSRPSSVQPSLHSPFWQHSWCSDEVAGNGGEKFGSYPKPKPICIDYENYDISNHIYI